VRWSGAAKRCKGSCVGGPEAGLHASIGKALCAIGVLTLMWRVALALLTAGLAAALGAGAWAAGGPIPRAAPVAASCPQAGQSTVDGSLLVTPPHARPGHVGLIVVVIPGGGGDPGDHLGVARAATAAALGVLYPTRANGGFWTLNRAQGTSDVTNVSDLLDRVLAGGCFDAKALTVTGVSNGAGFAQRLACALPGRFAVVVPIAAGYRALDPCPATERASFLDIHGTADSVVPYNGAPPLRKGSVPRNTARWAAQDGCRSGAGAFRTTRPQHLVTRTTYRGCAAGLHVEGVRLSGTDHGWPGAGPPLPDHNPSGFDATKELVRFVRAAGAAPS
jgi:polyhydroxybutyrate depolymerase